MSQEHLPEEKLLKIIRNKESLEKAQKKNVKKENLGLKESGTTKKTFLRKLNGLTFFLVLILVGFFTYGLLNLREEKKIVIDDLEMVEFSKIKVFDDSTQKPYNHYSNLIKTRDIFSRPEGKSELIDGGSQLEKKFRLVGIVLDGDPEAIVEDLQTRKTLFLHEGDFLKGSKVQQIQEGKIILLVDDQEIELVQ